MTITFNTLLEKLLQLEATLNALLSGTKPILTTEEAAQYLGVSMAQLYRFTSERRIPHSKPTGRKMYFDRAQLETWMRGNPVRTVEEIAATCTSRYSR